MSQGIYGTAIPANVDPLNDVEIWYNYKATKTSDSVSTSQYQPLDPSCLVKVTAPSINYITTNILEGMYTLRLPLLYFSQKGYYSVYIKPKEIPLVINDVSVLESYPDVKGIVIDTEQFNGTDEATKTLFLTNDSLVGYRIIYIKEGSRQEDVRIVTSNNKCEPMVQTSGGKTTIYRYNDNSSFTFITVTPSTAPSFKANAIPSIGTSGQKILLVNTKFEPVHIELEIVENDADTLATLISGNQLRSLDDGLITTFNSDNEIYKQQEVYTLKDSATGRPVYEVRKLRDNIDYSQELPQ